MEKKPKSAVFLFKAIPPDRPGVMQLPPCVGQERRYGRRECVAWLELPPFPEVANG